VDWRQALGGGSELGQVVKAVKEQLRSVPDNGVGYGLLRYLNKDTARVLAALPVPQVAFNYLGRFGAPTTRRPADWDLASDVATPVHRDGGQAVAHALEINVAATEDAAGHRLSVTWAWPAALLSEPEIRELSDAWFDVLRALVHHADEPTAGGHTPSDLAVGLNQDEIDELEAELGAAE
jgi:non-ribosomal peptide synthase protein (TIGR01720 family)